MPNWLNIVHFICIQGILTSAFVFMNVAFFPDIVYITKYGTKRDFVSMILCYLMILMAFVYLSGNTILSYFSK